MAGTIDSSSSVLFQLSLHLGIKVIHLVLQILSLAMRAVDLFDLAVQLATHDFGALVPALGVAVEGGTMDYYVSILLVSTIYGIPCELTGYRRSRC